MLKYLVAFLLLLFILLKRKSKNLMDLLYKKTGVRVVFLNSFHISSLDFVNYVESMTANFIKLQIQDVVFRFKMVNELPRIEIEVRSVDLNLNLLSIFLKPCNNLAPFDSTINELHLNASIMKGSLRRVLQQPPGLAPSETQASEDVP